MSTILTLSLTGEIADDMMLVATIDVAEIANGWTVKRRRENGSHRSVNLDENLTFFATMDEALAAAAAIFSADSESVRAAAIEARL